MSAHYRRLQGIRDLLAEVSNELIKLGFDMRLGDAATLCKYIRDLEAEVSARQIACDVLKEVEWVPQRSQEGPGPECPSCASEPRWGHQEGCELGAALEFLREVKGR